jgi:glycogen(starch) synthase
MKVLYWTESFWPIIGGVEVLSAQFIPAMRKRGYKFAVVTENWNLAFPDETQMDDIPVYRFHFKRILENHDTGQMMATLKKIAIIKQSFKPDLIHINICGPSIFFHLRTTSAYSVPMLVTLHSLMTQSCGHDTILGRLLRLADWVSTVSETTLHEIRNILPDITHYSSVIYNGVATPTLKPATLQFRPPRLLCLGRLIFDKGFDVALNAFASLTKRFPDAHLVIAGDGPARSALIQQANRLGLTHMVEFTGWVEPEKIPELVNTATVVIMPSRCSEAFGLVALQAAQMARPVVATRIGGLLEVVSHEETGLLVDKENSDALAEAIEFLLDHTEAAMRMGKAAQRRARKVFGWERFIDAYDILYRQLIEGKSKSAPLLNGKRLYESKSINRI